MHHTTYLKSGRRVLFLSAAFLLAAAVSFSCKKRESGVGKNTLTVEDLLASGAVDTFTLRTWSEVDDSIPTDNQQYGMVGTLNDPKMGLVTSSLYTQLRSSGTLSIPGTDVITIDSVVLAMEYGGFYGKNGPVTFEVYRLDDSLGLTTTYYKTTNKNVQPADLMLPGFETQTPKPATNTVVAGTAVAPQLRLRLNPALGLGILTDAQNGLAAFSDNAVFTSTYFKGLNVRITQTNPAPGEGAVYYFKMNATNTKMSIYYKLNGGTDQFQYSLLSNGLCADYNKVTVDNTGHDVETVINNPQTNPMERFYAQAHNTYGVVDLSTLKDLSSTSIIHNSMLELPVEHFPTSPFYPSLAIGVGYKVDGEVVLFDYASYDATSRSYLVDLRNFTQATVLGQVDASQLYFCPVLMGSAPERIIFNGPNTINKGKPRLLVKYTEY